MSIQITPTNLTDNVKSRKTVVNFNSVYRHYFVLLLEV